MYTKLNYKFNYRLTNNDLKITITIYLYGYCYS